MSIENFLVYIVPVLVVLAVFEGILKAFALWKCGRNRQLVWYILIFILNTAGILPLLYLLFFKKKKR